MPGPVLDVDLIDLAASARAVGLSAGLGAVGIGSAERFDDTRAVLEERRAAGLAADMAFTYRNPARSTDPDQFLSGAAAIVVGALSYGRSDAMEAKTADGGQQVRLRGRIARYAWADHYRALRDALTTVAEVLRRAGYRALVVADDNAMVDRAAAVRAGIGWYGKNANVLLPGRGSWFVLGSVVTDAPLPADGPSWGGCGTCTRCIPACPTGAIVAPGVVDARRCLAWLVQAPGEFPVEHRVALGDRIYGCDECQEVCPPNRVHPGPPAGAGDDTGVDLIWLLTASDTEVMARHGRWYIADRDPRHLRRNALIALGNVGDGADPMVVEVLRSYLARPDPMLQDHARWAATRLSRDDVIADVAAVDKQRP